MHDNEPDVVECIKCGENMARVNANYESGSWVVGYRCNNCHASELNEDKDPLALLIRESERLLKECQNRINGYE